MAFCTNCGQKLPEGIKFCFNCGSQVIDRNTIKEEQNTTREVTNEWEQVSPIERNTSTTTFSSSTEEQRQWSPIPPSTEADSRQQWSPIPPSTKTDSRQQWSSIPPSTPMKTGRGYGKDPQKLVGMAIAALILAAVGWFLHSTALATLLSIVAIGLAAWTIWKHIPQKSIPIIALILAAIQLTYVFVGDFTQQKKNDEVRSEISRNIEEAQQKNWESAQNNEISEAVNEVSETINEIKEVYGWESKDDSSATEKNTAKEQIVEESDEKQAEKNVEKSQDKGLGKAGGVTPELKEFLDSYEAFMDEYVLFMKNYTANPGDAMSMLTDYYKMLEKMEDFQEKADAYDQDKMSDADLAYYLEVITRIEMKLLSAY